MKEKKHQNVPSPLSRRDFIKAGGGTAVGVGAGALLAGNALAQVCGIATGKQPLGPFFPSEGTAERPIREDADPAIPSYLANDNDLTFVRGKQGTAAGQVAHIHGHISDENCRPVSSATVVIWQACASGRYNHRGDVDNRDFRHPLTGETIQRTLDPSFQFWGQATTDEAGEYQFKTVVPGFYPANLQSGWYRPPHIHFLLSFIGHPQFVTQMYFRGADIADNDWIQQLNQRDVLLQNPDMSGQQREQLIVDFQASPEGLRGRFDLALPKT